MTEANGSQKARQSAENRSGGSECRNTGNGTGGTDRASQAKPARLIGGPLSGPGRQMQICSSFGGLLPERDQFSQELEGDIRYVAPIRRIDRADPIARRDRAPTTHCLRRHVGNTDIFRKIGQSRPPVDDVGMGHAEMGTINTTSSSMANVVICTK